MKTRRKKRKREERRRRGRRNKLREKHSGALAEASEATSAADAWQNSLEDLTSDGVRPTAEATAAALATKREGAEVEAWEVLAVEKTERFEQESDNTLDENGNTVNLGTTSVSS